MSDVRRGTCVTCPSGVPLPPAARNPRNQPTLAEASLSMPTPELYDIFSVAPNLGRRPNIGLRITLVIFEVSGELLLKFAS